MTLTYQSETGKEGTLTAQDKANIYGITIDKVNLKGDKLKGAKFDLYYGEEKPTLTGDNKSTAVWKRKLRAATRRWRSPLRS